MTKQEKIENVQNLAKILASPCYFVIDAQDSKSVILIIFDENVMKKILLTK